MTARVRTIVEWIDGAKASVIHEMPEGARLEHPNLRLGIAGRVVGPNNDPYWLTSTGQKLKKLP